MEVAHIIEIQQLLGRYGHAIDERDWAAFRELFVADAVLDYTAVRAPSVLHGIDDIVDWFTRANHPSAHHVTNVVVTDDAGTIRVHSKWFAPYTRRTHSPIRWAGGDYHDLVVQTPAGWRFSEKVCLPRWQFTPEGQGPVPDHRRTY
jgi:3-phenylpropionate/cinnamic acid dioxygenase small subunit